MNNNTQLESEQNLTATPYPVISEGAVPTDTSPAIRKWKLLFIGIFFTILAIPVIASIINLPKTPLNGLTKSNPVKPVYSVRGALNGSYPYEFEVWFNQNFPFRTYLVRSYFQLRYNMFRTSGTDNIVFMDDDNMNNELYIKEAMGLMPPSPLQGIQEYAGILRAIQDKCDVLGKKYIHIIPANKANILEDKTPLRYRLAGMDNDLADSSYDRMKAALDKAGVRYVDSVKLLSAYKNPEELFSRTGVHWNHVAAALVMREALNGSYGLNLEQFKILGVKESGVPSYPEDLDLFSLSNIFTPIRACYHTPILQKASGKPLDAFIIGTSFNQQIARVVKDAGLASSVREIRYSQTIGEYSNTVQPTFRQVNNVSDIDFASYASSGLIISTSSPVNDANGALTLTARCVNDALGEIISPQNSLPADAANVTIKITKPSKLIAMNGRYIQIPVALTNHGAYPQDSSGPHPVYLTTHWKNPDGSNAKWINYMHPLPAVLMPGQTINTVVNSHFGGGTPGHYILEITMAQKKGTAVKYYEKVNPNIVVSLPVTFRGE